jgi:hypothetical protein
MEKPFVFVIGFNKCATSAIHSFFSRNDFPSVHWDRGRLAPHMVMNCIWGRKIFHGYDRQFRVFSDLFFMNERIVIEGNQYFRVMDRDYPGSFFIYNTRSMDKWLQSRLRHGPDGAVMIDRFKYLFGTDDTNVIIRYWIDLRTRFEAELKEYFAGSERFLILNIESKDPAGQIARFLGMDLNLAAWQHMHATTAERIQNRPTLQGLTATGPS